MARDSTTGGRSRQTGNGNAPTGLTGVGGRSRVFVLSTVVREPNASPLRRRRSTTPLDVAIAKTVQDRDTIALERRMGAVRGRDDPWTPELAARVAEELHERLPREQWEERVAWPDDALIALERARRESDLFAEVTVA